MLKLRLIQYGITLIELLVAVALVGILFALAMPNYSSWIRSQQVRTGAESILNGIQLARSTAVNSNTQARFNLCDTLSSWQVLVASSAAATFDAAALPCGAGVTLSTAMNNANEIRVQRRFNTEGSKSVMVSAASGITTTIPLTDDGSRSITFNSIGRVVTNDTAVGGSSISTIAVGAIGGARTLLVIVRPGGSVKMCDPNLTVGTAAQQADPRAC